MHLHGRSHGIDNAIYVGNHIGDALNLKGGVPGGPLDAPHLASDPLGCLGCLAGKFLDLTGHNGKPPARLPCAGGFNGGVQCKEVGLLGDLGDHLCNLPNLPCGPIQPRHVPGSFLGTFHATGGNFKGPGRLTGDTGHGTGHLLHGAGGYLHVRGRLGHRSRDGGGVLLHGRGIGGHTVNLVGGLFRCPHHLL